LGSSGRSGASCRCPPAHWSSHTVMTTTCLLEELTRKVVLCCAVLCSVLCSVRQSFNPDTASAIAFFCVAGLAGVSMVFTLVFGLYGTVGGTIYVAAKAANNARLEVRVCTDMLAADLRFRLPATDLLRKGLVHHCLFLCASGWWRGRAAAVYQAWSRRRWVRRTARWRWRLRRPPAAWRRETATLGVIVHGVVSRVLARAGGGRSRALRRDAAALRMRSRGGSVPPAGPGRGRMQPRRAPGATTLC